MEGVCSLNRNYPYMWGMYGTSDTRGSCPASGTYRGPSEGSEIETQANMELMRGMNLGSHDGFLYRLSKTGLINDNISEMLNKVPIGSVASIAHLGTSIVATSNETTDLKESLSEYGKVLEF